jgi:hypothetical protein
VLVSECGSTFGTAKPSTIVLACGDGNAKLINLTWSTWGSSDALGRGDYDWNDCVPTCVGGTFHASPAALTLRDVQTVRGAAYFSAVTVAFTGTSPFGDNRAHDFPLDIP